PYTTLFRSTLLQEPDLVFLIPAEHKMNDYFKRAIVYSFVSQLLTLLFIVAALSPLYFHSFPERGGREFLLTLLIVLVFKAWNLVDRKSTRLNSSHVSISYAVFCLKKKKTSEPM